MPRSPYAANLPCCRQVDLDPAERHFLALWGDHLSVHEASTGRRVVADYCPEEGLRRARLAPDGSRIALGTRDDRVQLLDWRGQKVLARSPALGDYLGELHWLPGGDLLVGATQSNRVVVQDGVDLHTVRQLSPRGDAGYEPFGGMGISPDGTRLFLASGQRLRCLDSATGEAIWELNAPDQAPHNPALSPDGSRVAVADPRGVALIDSATGGGGRPGQLFPLSGHPLPWNARPGAGMVPLPRLFS